MKKSIVRVVVLSLLSTAIALAPTTGWAQEDKKADAEKKEAPAKKKRDVLPFNGKVGAIDKTAKSIKVGERVFLVTSETRLMKAGKPATLDDAAVGEEVSGAYRRTDDGKLNLISVRFGPRPEGEPKGEKKGKQKQETE